MKYDDAGAPKVPGHHIEEDDVITAGPTPPIRVVSVRKQDGVPVARCIVGNVSRYLVTFTCESLARFVATNGKSELVITEKTRVLYGVQARRNDRRI